MSVTTPTSRRSRGTAAGSVPLFAHVAPEAKAVVDRVAEATGAPKWAVIEAILSHVEIGDDGVPVWWTVPTPNQGELPLRHSA